ncbi:MAG TPA: sigma-70 family RNA polymerase sigma factor, partial [Thermoanaerobaculia bacterium]
MTDIDAIALRARDGDVRALRALLRSLQQRIYDVAVRMLWYPDEAREATNAILLHVLKQLNSFGGEVPVTSWAWHVAASHLLTARKSRRELDQLTFGKLAVQIESSLGEEPVLLDETQRLLSEEIHIGCTHAMLLCLDREYRLAYILGEICDISGKEGAYIFDITPDAFRQRLSRARAAIRTFKNDNCGVANPSNPCRCSRRIEDALRTGWADVDNLLFARGIDP